jgi:hypothetical protein
MSISIESTVTHIPTRPLPRRRLKRYVPPPKPKMRKYIVEVKRGAGSTSRFPWWGPLDIANLIRELQDEGFHPVQMWFDE